MIIILLSLRVKLCLRDKKTCTKDKKQTTYTTDNNWFKQCNLHATSFFDIIELIHQTMATIQWNHIFKNIAAVKIQMLGCSGNDIGHTNEVKLRQTLLVLGLVMTFFAGLPSQYLSRPFRPTQPDHPSVGRCNEYWRWSRIPLGKKWRVLWSSRPCNRECWHASWLKTLAC